MIIVVAKEGKIYYVREITGMGISIKKSEDNKFMLCLDDRTEPIAIYKKWENANNAMEEITKTYANTVHGNGIAVISPND